MNTYLRKKTKNGFQKYLFKFINNAKLWKKHMRKHRDIKLVTTERRRNYLISEPSYHITKVFTENLLVI